MARATRWRKNIGHPAIGALVYWLNGNPVSEPMRPFHERFREELLKFLEQERPSKLVIDFHQTSTFISSATNSVFFQAMRKISDWECRLRFCMDERNHSSYASLKLDRHFPVFLESRQDAIMALAEVRSAQGERPGEPGN